MTRTLALIPARGGSKGVPGKNLREVGGQPLLVWSVSQALAMTISDVDVVVSTDDPAGPCPPPVRRGHDLRGSSDQ